MAITARFDADFSSFNTAVKEAEGSLRGLETGTNNTQKSLDAMGNQLSTLKINEALSNPLDTATDAALRFADALGPIGIALGSVVVAGALWATQLISFAKEAAEAGSRINDMSDKTGIAIPALSNLSAAATIAGSSIEQVSSAITLMQQRMVEGGPQVEKGFKRIGLSIQEIRTLSPDQQFLQIAAAIKAISDPADRAATAIEIFGRSGRELLPLLSKDINALVQESEELGLTWSERDSKAAEEFEQQSKALDLAIQNVKTTIGRELVPALTTGLVFAKNSVGYILTATPLAPILRDLEFLNAAFGKTAEHLQAVKPAPGFAAVDDSINELTKSLIAEAEAAQTSEIANEAFAASEAKRAALEVRAASDRSKRESENQKIRMDRLNEVNKAILDSFEVIRKAEQELADFEDQTWMSTTDFQVKKVWERADQAIASFKGTEDQRAQFASITLQRASAEADALYTKEAEFAQKTAKSFKDMTDAEAAAVLTNAQWLDYLVEKQNAAKAAEDALRGSFKETAGVLSGEVASALQGYAESLDRLAVTPGSSLGFSHGPMVQTALTVPARAWGGSVSAGQPYLVGENGPELFTPSTSGMITPNGGGTTIQLVVDGRVLSEIVAKDWMRRSTGKLGVS